MPVVVAQLEFLIFSIYTERTVHLRDLEPAHTYNVTVSAMMSDYIAHSDVTKFTTGSQNFAEYIIASSLYLKVEIVLVCLIGSIYIYVVYCRLLQQENTFICLFIKAWPFICFFSLNADF